MNKDEQLNMEIKKQIELLKQEIKVKQMVLDSLLQQLDDMDDDN